MVQSRPACVPVGLLCIRWRRSHFSSLFGGNTILPLCFQRRMDGSMADLMNSNW